MQKTTARGCAVTIVLIAALLQIGSAGDELGTEVAKGPDSLWMHMIDVSLVSEPQPYLVLCVWFTKNRGPLQAHN